MRLRTPLARVRGLGSAKEGAHHWWVQRVTAVALVPLCVWFVYSLLSVLLAGDHMSMAEWLAKPFPALMMMLFISAMFYHSKLGIQVVIEDYVHGEAMKVFLLLFNSFVHWTLGLMGILAVVKLHLLDVTSIGV